ncbi:MAG TPA: transglycosylase SLT domain-containing protein [Pyrinomonadaceae bacterium]|nr:transglycosylase SLT domain-containing protein [Pyrinomonadaceae bacterium]
MRTTYRQHQVVFVSVVFSVAAAAALLLLPFTSVSCKSAQPQHRAGEAEAVERLRALTHAAPPVTMPAESAVASIETQYANAAAGALARFIRARVKIAAGDFAGAATLLDTGAFRQQTALGDYALLLRADALARSGRRTEARAAYEQLARDYPMSLRAREAALRNAELALQENAAAAVPLLLKNLSDADDAGALLLTAKAYEQTGDTARALNAYRRLYFFAPASPETKDAMSALTRLGATLAPASALEATTRANKLYDAKVYAAAAAAFGEAFTRFPATATSEAQLRRGIAAFNVGSTRLPEAAAALNAVPASAPADARVEALYYLAQTHAKARQWEQARAVHAEMRRAFPEHTLTRRALAAAGQIARDAKNTVEAANFFRAAVAAYPGASEVAQAQFELAWAAHEAKNYAESSRLLLEHLASYADRNTDNRGRAGYWAARDAERAGQTAQARALYEAMLQRYDANWYGDLARQRLDTLKRTNPNATTDFPAGSPVARAVVNLSTVSVAEETATAEANAPLAKADQLNVVGLDEYALDEVNKVLESAPRSPRLNLAKARIYRTRQQNLHAFLALQKSYPDYSQMKPEELTREEWDVFYPLAYWDAITREARARSIDPYRIAGLIRQESVFDPRAASHANAYGLMQLLLDTAQSTARKYGISRTITRDVLLADPQLNIQLGTGYLRDQLDRFGRIEYVAAAYNAGPGRAVRWRVELPAEMDEWAEAVPFRETRGYVQGVVRNTLQYKRLYDERGQFRAEVGARAVRPNVTANAPDAPPSNSTVRPRRATPDEQQLEEDR